MSITLEKSSTTNDILGLLLENKADPLLKNNDGKSALELAQEASLTGIVTKLQNPSTTQAQAPFKHISSCKTQYITFHFLANTERNK